MSTTNNFLTDLSQLDEFNQNVWLILERDRKISENLSEHGLVDISSGEKSVIVNTATTVAADLPTVPGGRPTE